MKIDRGVLLLGAFFGAVALIICLFLLPPYIALLFAAFTAALYIVVIGFAVNRAARKHDGDDEIIRHEILLRGNANYYPHTGVCNGMLYLTEGSLFFISHEKKPTLIEEVSLNLIKDISYGTRHAAELQIVMLDGTERKFIGAAVRDFALRINELRDSADGIFTYLKGELGCDCWMLKDIEDVSGIMEKYEDFLAQWKTEGFTPLIVLSSELLCENIDEVLLSNNEIIESAKAINAAEFLKKRIAEAMSWGEDWEYDIMGEFTDREPVPLFQSLIDPAESECDTRRPYETIIFAKIPTANPWELAAWIPMGGWNECPAPEEQAAIFKYWYEKYGAIPAAVCENGWEMYVERPPVTRDEAAALALEQFGFCGDIVWQGVGKVNALASMLVNAKVWYFWWD